MLKSFNVKRLKKKIKILRKGCCFKIYFEVFYVDHPSNNEDRAQVHFSKFFPTHIVSSMLNIVYYIDSGLDS